METNTNIKKEDLKDIEKEFFNCFGIKEDISENAYFTGNIGYPGIYSYTLINLICINATYSLGYFNHVGSINSNPYLIWSTDPISLEEQVLKDSIRIYTELLEKEEYKKQYKDEIIKIMAG